MIVNPYEAQNVRFLDGPAVPIFLPGATVPGDLGLAALFLDDLPADVRSSAVVYARDPNGNPVVWVVAPP